MVFAQPARNDSRVWVVQKNHLIPDPTTAAKTSDRLVGNVTFKFLSSLLDRPRVKTLVVTRDCSSASRSTKRMVEHEALPAEELLRQSVTSSVNGTSDTLVQSHPQKVIPLIGAMGHTREKE